MDAAAVQDYLGDCRRRVLTELNEIVPRNRYAGVLYDLLLDYPLRGGKCFRPALCIATCRALGGRLQDVLATAATLELFHNAFLGIDDIQDRSSLRRGLPTLYASYGMPIAVNVGVASLALCLAPLLENTRRLGLAKALKILDLVSAMVRNSVEGQAVELSWVRAGCAHRLTDRHYCWMCYKKTCCYSFIAPMQIGAVVAGARRELLRSIRRYGTYLGLAFQIQDDILNLQADERYGKEIGGDLWEGKHTLILIHMMRTVSRRRRQRAQEILQKPREDKTEGEVRLLRDLIQSSSSLEYAGRAARLFAGKAGDLLGRDLSALKPSVHREFLLAMTHHVRTRET